LHVGVRLGGKHRIDRDRALARQLDETLRQLRVAGSERSANFLVRDRRIEAAFELEIGNSRRIVARRKRAAGIDPARQGPCGAERQSDGERERQHGIQTRHASSSHCIARCLT
jgi:hypothetical protein